MLTLKCKRCGHEWIARITKPKQCPKCRSYNWDIYSPLKCEVCGRIFKKIGIHHKDGNRNNENKENLLKICVDCHSIIHNGISEKYISKRVRNYQNNPLILNKLKKLHNFWFVNKNKLKLEEEE